MQTVVIDIVNYCRVQFSFGFPEQSCRFTVKTSRLNIIWMILCSANL